MTLKKYGQEDADEITAVGVPNPNKSGTHEIGSLECVEKMLVETNERIRASGDPTCPDYMVRIYLLGYRDALMGRRPNVPE